LEKPEEPVQDTQTLISPTEDEASDAEEAPVKEVPSPSAEESEEPQDTPIPNPEENVVPEPEPDETTFQDLPPE
jgi:hypothetical protein